MPKYNTKNKKEAHYAFTGRLYCGACGMPMVGIHGNGNGGKYYYYSCNSRRVDHMEPCGMPNVNKKELEDFILRETVDYVLREDIINQIADAVDANNKKWKKILSFRT